MLSRILVGARYSIGVAAAASLFAIVLGGTLGMLAAVSRGSVDMVLSRFFDALISIQSKISALVVVAALGSSIPVLIGTIVIFTPGAFRIRRALAINVNALDFVEVACARGENAAYVMREAILPNIMGPCPDRLWCPLCICGTAPVELLVSRSRNSAAQCRLRLAHS
nr:ABC transporter permease subunit [Bradyrhizobium sp. CCGB12]